MIKTKSQNWQIVLFKINFDEEMMHFLNLIKELSHKTHVNELCQMKAQLIIEDNTQSMGNRLWF